MDNKKPFPKKHLFICTNQKQGKKCCAQKEALLLKDKLKEHFLLQKEDYAKTIRINASGCLGRCEEGIAAVLYPDGKWFLNLDSQNGFEILRDALSRNKEPQ